jgi:hypothetical protein
MFIREVMMLFLELRSEAGPEAHADWVVDWRWFGE